MSGDLATLPAPEGARALVGALLAEADAAAERLRAGADPEALHDFRVALRRLRSTLRAFREPLRPAVKRRHERRLAKLARATNAARDAEVQLAWIAAHAKELSTPRLAAGAALLRARFEAQRPAQDGHEELLERHARLARKLARRIAIPGDDAGAGDSFAAALATLAEEHLARLQGAADRIAGASDEEGVHRARIAAKRLRYLLEPLRGAPGTDTRPAVNALKRLQDALGELHDRHVLGGEIATALGEATAGRAGLRAAERLAARERDLLYAGLLADLRAGDLASLGGEVASLASAARGRRRSDG